MNAQAVPNTPGKIYAAMAAIQREVGGVAKAKKSTQGYHYRGIDDIYAALQGLMAEKGVVSVPAVIEQHREERRTRNDGVLIYSVLTVRYTFYAEDGSSIEAVTVGEGMDSSDKSSNKAMSAAEKYALIQAFKLPTTDVRDSEVEDPRPAARQPQPQPAPKPQQQPARREIQGGPATKPAAVNAPRFEQLARTRLQERGLKGGEIDEAVDYIRASYETSCLDLLSADQRTRVLRGIAVGQADQFILKGAGAA